MDTMTALTTPMTTVQFAAAARLLADAARRCGVRPPSFRSPPGVVGLDRTVRRRRDVPIVAVRLGGRPSAAVIADMIDGVVAANRLMAPDADRLRAELWRAVAGAWVDTAAPTRVA